MALSPRLKALAIDPTQENAATPAPEAQSTLEMMRAQSQRSSQDASLPSTADLHVHYHLAKVCSYCDATVTASSSSLSLWAGRLPKSDDTEPQAGPSRRETTPPDDSARTDLWHYNPASRVVPIPQAVYQTGVIGTSLSVNFESPWTAALEGVALSEILRTRRSVKNGNEKPLAGYGLRSVIFRILWPGYAPWEQEIVVWDLHQGDITRVQLGLAIARVFSTFIAGKHKPDQSVGNAWRFGSRSRQNFDIYSLRLVKFWNVDGNSWQAQIHGIRE